MQAVLICDETTPKTETWIERLFTPFGISAIVLFVGANIILAGTINNNQAITEIQPEVEGMSTQVPNLAAEELAKLDLQKIVTLKPKSKVPESKDNTGTIKVTVIPGAYTDLASALLPPSLRPYHYKSHILEPISASELPDKLQKLR